MVWCDGTEDGPWQTRCLIPSWSNTPVLTASRWRESDFQFTPLTYVRNALRHYYRNRRDVYVSGNLLLYYEEGNPGAKVAPDVFVVIGAPSHDRSSYLLWDEPKAPDWVLEVTSHGTEHKDRGEKRALYRKLGGGGVLAL